MNLYTAKTYQITLTDTPIFNGNTKDALETIFFEFEISTNADDDFDNEYDIERSELVRLRDKITNRTDYFKEREESFNGQLRKMNITLEKFVQLLNDLISKSDPNNSHVLLTWL